jgi:hypothetical protein
MSDFMTGALYRRRAEGAKEYSPALPGGGGEFTMKAQRRRGILGVHIGGGWLVSGKFEVARLFGALRMVVCIPNRAGT